MLIQASFEVLLQHFQQKQKAQVMVNYFVEFLLTINFQMFYSRLQSDSTAPKNDKTVFSYDDNDEFGPSNWDLISENCGGRQQSPINLISHFSVKVLSNPFKIGGFSEVPDAVTITNNGHSIMIKWASSGTPANFSGGVLNGTFIIESAHFHWGEDDEFGSEHLLNSRRYSLEVHIKSFNSKYGKLIVSHSCISKFEDINKPLTTYVGSFSNAATKPHGLAVLAFLFEVFYNQIFLHKFLHVLFDPQVDFNAEHLPFIDDIPSIVRQGSSVNTKVFSIKDLIIYKHFEYYSYSGSTTTPNCYETVTWMVSTKILRVNPDDLYELRTLKNHDGRDVVENFRPEQESNFRRVTFQSTL